MSNVETGDSMGMFSKTDTGWEIEVVLFYE